MAELLDAHAPMRACPLVPELRVFHAHGLIEVWEAAERLAKQNLPAPFWAYPWPAGAALARVVLDNADWVRDKRVLDLGCGGGIASLAAATAGAREVVANDIDPWSIETARLAAERAGYTLTPRLGDLTAAAEPIEDFDVVLCADLCYERRATPPLRTFLERLHRRGARALVADAERKYFDPSGMRQIAEFSVEVPVDLEGVGRRCARVYEVV